METPKRYPGFRVEAVHAFLAIDDGDEEGVVAVTVPGVGSMPLLAANAERLDQIRPIAERIARESGKTIKLVRFTQREELETIVAEATEKREDGLDPEFAFTLCPTCDARWAFPVVPVGSSLPFPCGHPWRLHRPGKDGARTYHVTEERQGAPSG